MKFKIDPVFEHYWPPLPEEKFIILEKSILEDGLKENLTVWKEKNVLLDGHQRLRALEKHGISFDNRITYLSFPDEVHAKHWVYITQVARRGDAPQFLSICRVLEFEPIYREEAQGRMRAGKKSLSTNGAEGKGQSRDFMARDAATSKNSVERVLYIRDHDPSRFVSLRDLAATGGDYESDGGPGRGKGTKEISIHLEWSKVKALVDTEAAGSPIDKVALEKFNSSNTVRDFAEAVTKFSPSATAQRAAADTIINSEEAANKDYVESAVMRQLPKKKTEKVKEFSDFIKKCAKAAAALKTDLKILDDYRADLTGPFYSGKFNTTVLFNNLNLLRYQIEEILKSEGSDEKKLTA